VTPKTVALLIASTLANVAICYSSFIFMVFATSPRTDDVTMRVGFYVLSAISAAAFAAVFAPWVFVHFRRRGIAALAAHLPAVLVVFAVAGFWLLDSWLNRTFS